MGLNLFIQSLWEMPLWFFSVVATVVVSITVHELAHGIAAVKLGDRTPIESGHMTLNPLVHMGPMSLVALLIAGIAWGAMPIDPTRMRGRYAEALVAVAGPLSNLLMSLAALLALGVWMRVAEPAERPEKSGTSLAHLVLATDAAPSPMRELQVRRWVAPVQEGDANESSPFQQNTRFFLFVFGSINLVLCIFNLLPVPPLDGAHILANFHRGYGRFIGDPANAGVMMVAFLFAFMVGSRIFSAVYGWSLGLVGLAAGVF